MTDIVERLRTKIDPSVHEYEYARLGEREEAADEIERLRETLTVLWVAMQDHDGFRRVWFSTEVGRALTGREDK